MEVSGRKGDVPEQNGRKGDIPQQDEMIGDIPEEIGTATSAEGITHYCDPCFEDGNRVEARGYCTDCRDYLCGDCYKIHSRVKLTRNHILQDRDTMPEGKHDLAEASHKHDQLTDPCSAHSGKTIEYHCKKHRKLGCSVCVTVDHRNCQEIKFIPDVSKGIGESQECKTIEKTLDELIEQLNNIEHQASDTRQMLIEDSREYTMSAQQYRNVIVALIDELLTNAESKKETHVNKLLSRLNTAEKSIQEQRASLMNAKSEINARLKAHRENSLFVSLMAAETLIDRCNETVSTVKTESNVKSFEFDRNLVLSQLVRGIDTLGTLSELNEINIHAPKDKNECTLVVPYFLTDGRLILTDYNNKSVKVFATDKTLTSCITAISKPCGITEVKGDKVQVIITMPENNNLQYFAVSDQLAPGQVFQTDYPYFGITHCHDNLAVTDVFGNVHILDMNGKLLKSINPTVNDVVTLAHLQFHPDNNRLYVTTHEQDSVTCMTMDGEVINVYKDNKLSGPRGLTIHPDGSIYICGNSSNNIHHITAECKKIDMYPKYGKVVRPSYTCVNKAESKLYVFEMKNNSMKAFKIKSRIFDLKSENPSAMHKM